MEGVIAPVRGGRRGDRSVSKRPLVWYEEQESGIELGELWELLLRHGFIMGTLANSISQQRARVEAFANDLHVELVRSEVERMRVPPPESCADVDDEGRGA